MDIFGFGTKSVAEAQTAYDAAVAAESGESDSVKKAELGKATADAKLTLEKAKVAEAAKSGPATSGTAPMDGKGRRKHKGGRHTKKHRASRKGKSTRARSGRKSSRL